MVFAIITNKITKKVKLVGTKLLYVYRIRIEGTLGLKWKASFFF
jgi:hypothetical protein